MMFQVTAIYAAIMTIGLVMLSTRVSIQRGKSGMSLGWGDDTALLEKIRGHGNFTENVPIVLILMALAEAQGLGAVWLHSAGILLIVSRPLHAFGLRADKSFTFGRIAGGIGTQIAMLIPIVAILRGATGW